MKKIVFRIGFFQTHFPILILFFILLSNTVLAESREIFSDSIEEEASEEIDGETYTAHEYNDYAGVRLSSNKYGSIIIDKEGSSVTKGPYTFTLDEIVEEDNKVSFKITIEKEEATVSVSKSAGNSTGTLGSTITITVTISNEGEDSATIIYAEDLPKEVSLAGTPEITKGSSTSTQKSTAADVYWSGVLYKGESATIVYDITIEDYPDNDTTIYLDDVMFTYEDDSGEYTDEVDSVSISLSTPVSVSFALVTDEDDLKIGREAEYTVTITNNLAKTATIDSFLLTIPSTLEPSWIDPYLEDSEEGYTWTGQLNSFEDVSFTILLIPQGTGTHTLSAEAEYSSTSGAGSTSYTTSFTIEAGAVVPEIKLSSETFDGGEEIIIYYYVNNSDEDVSYSNANIKIHAEPDDLFDSISYLVSLPKKTKTLIKKQNFIAPYTDEEMEYTISMTGAYGISTFKETETVTINSATFPVPYEVLYAVGGSDEEYTNVTLTINLLTTLTDKPAQLAVVHRADPEYKKTVSLTKEEIDTLFSEQTRSRSWSIPVISFTENEVELDVQLQYVVGSNNYYHFFTETIPVYHEEVIEETENETITADENKTISGEGALHTEIESNPTINETEKSKIIITGEKEKTSKKWIWLFLIVLSIGAAAFSIHYFFMKKQKKAAMKRAIQSINSKDGKEENKESIFQRAKKIIIQEIPSPEDGYDRLERYLKRTVSQGKAEAEIKNILLAKGWIEDILDSYLRRMK